MSKYIVSIGMVCVDVVLVCEDYPQEDSESRPKQVESRRGGNASNSATVLSLLGQKTMFLGNLPKENDSQTNFVTSDFDKYGIDWSHCNYLGNDVSIRTFIIVNSQNGSRTILKDIHNYEEVTFEQFDKLDLAGIKWVHLEGRVNHDAIKQIMGKIKKFNQNNDCDSKERIKVSVEFERPRFKIDMLHENWDFAFISRAYSNLHGYHSLEEAAKGFAQNISHNKGFNVAWGEEGATSVDIKDGEKVVHHPAQVPENGVKDTIGAGDTFNAACIAKLAGGHDIHSATEFACKVAGSKCGASGFDVVKKFALKK